MHSYSFRGYIACTTTLGVAFSFGGKSWPINEEDMNRGQDPDEPSKCLGAIFDGGLPSGGSLSWIIGDAFLVSSQGINENT